MLVDDFCIAPDLTLPLGAEAARLMPGAGLRLAERLIRLRTRRLIELEVELPRDAAGLRSRRADGNRRRAPRKVSQNIEG